MNHLLILRIVLRSIWTALSIKRWRSKRTRSNTPGPCAGKKLYMLFQKTSTRTALSFAFGMTGLGGEYFTQNWNDSNFYCRRDAGRSKICIAQRGRDHARLKNNADINLMAKYSTVPVINGCCDRFHPCQAIADLVTVKEIFGTLKVKLVYIGVANNVLNSLMDSLRDWAAIFMPLRRTERSVYRCRVI